ncbi:MAG: RNA polymerase sigma factor [Mariniphaga sp.]|jgi:RNA polymerase sigma-70 factor (ECF subfamily)|nr:RNA polymerase sigma factor [Mariniphaga sp.]
MNETEIIAGLKQGNEAAFKELVDSHRQIVVNTCFGLLHNISDAEDVAQEVFIEVFRSVDKFRADSKISTWLYRIAVNRSFNFIRDNKKRKFHSYNELSESKKELLNQQVQEGADTPESDMENNQRKIILHEAVDALPQNQRVAFTLNKYEDLSYKEISDVMNLSVSSVESLIHRAKKNLQKKLYHCFKKKCI